MKPPVAPWRRQLQSPRLHPNPLRAALQVLSWLLFRPSAWRQQLQQVAPDLAPDFTLFHLTRQHWRQPLLRRLLIIIYLLWPTLMATLVALVLWGGLGQNVQTSLLGAGVSFGLSLGGGLLLSSFFSVAAGLSGVILAGLALGLAIALSGGLLTAGSFTTANSSIAQLTLAKVESADVTGAVSLHHDNGAATPPPQATSLAITGFTAPTQSVAAKAVSMAQPASAELQPWSTASVGPENPVTQTSALTTAGAVILDTIDTAAMPGSSVSPLATPVAVSAYDAVAAVEAAPLGMQNATSLSPIATPLANLLLGQTAAPVAVASQAQQETAEATAHVAIEANQSANGVRSTPGLAPSELRPGANLFSALFGLTGLLSLAVIGMMVGLATLMGSPVSTMGAGSTATRWRSRLGAVAVGGLLSIGCVVLTLMLAKPLLQVLHNQLWLVMSGQGLLVALVIGWRTQRWAGGLLTAVGLSTLLFLLSTNILSTNTGVGFMGGMGYGDTGSAVRFLLFAAVNTGLTGSLLLTLPYLVGERLAGALAGGIAGALGGGGALVSLLLLGASFPLWPHLPLGLLALAFGLALPVWWPLVRYPLMATWSALLLSVAKRHTAQAGLYLTYHPALWDELQPLPLPGLEEHLLLAVEQPGKQDQQLLTLFSTGHQRWAAQAAQIELDARCLAACQQLIDIPSACQRLSASELANMASSILRAFGRIGADIEVALAQESLYHQRLALSAVEERLDSLLRELTYSAERYAARFQPIAAAWWRLVHHEVAMLTADAELRQEIESPYIIGIPLTAQQEIFVGRADICERIEQLLRDPHHPPLLLYGQRRMGKTSLLNNLGRLLPSTIVPLFVDLQGPVALAGDHASFLYNLARAMSDSARRQRDLVLPPLARTELAADPFTCFDEWLDAVEGTLGDAVTLLALDEFEVLDSAFATGRLQAEAVLGSLRHWVQHRPRFKILLTGSHVVEELRSWANYLINVQVVHIGYLEEAETYRLVEHPVQEFALRYEPAAAQRVWQLTHGHPALTQLLCYEIVALKNRQPPVARRLATVADVESAADEALERGALFFHELATGQLTPEARALLHWLASQGEGALVSVTKVQAAWPVGLKPALTLLLRRELLEYVHGGYRIQVELIRRWFARRPGDD